MPPKPKAFAAALLVVVSTLFGAASPTAAAAPDAKPSAARGRYLMNGIVACGNCHLARDAQGAPLFDKGLSGGMPFEEPMFRSYAANITPDVETGIGRWTDAQLVKAIREGIRPDGSVIGPPMPIEFYRHLSDADVAALVGVLRAQPAVRNAVPKSTYSMPLPPDYGPPVGRVATPPRADKVRYGAYLASIGHCMECHTPRSADGRLRTDAIGAGGSVFKGPWGESVSRNLTPHESGLKNWSDAQIARAIRAGVDRGGHPYKPPMAFAFYRSIDDADMAALVAYLRTLPPRRFAGER